MPVLKPIAKAVTVLGAGLLTAANGPAPTTLAETMDGQPFTQVERETNGYPTKASVEMLFDEMAFHGATQAYLWGVPALTNYTWLREQRRLAGPVDYVTYTSVADKMGILTPNMTTPYTLAFLNLKETGPLIVTIPPGPTAGIMNDVMHRNITDTGLVGPDGGKGGKYLVLYEDWDEPEGHGADFIVRSKSYIFWTGSRMLTNDAAEAGQLTNGHLIQSLDGALASQIIPVGGREYRAWHPDGMAFWEMLHELVQIEDFTAEDRYILQFLQRVGIEKGKAFTPDARQKSILLRAEAIGKDMAAMLSARRERNSGTYYNDGTKWTVHLGGLSNAQHINPANRMKELDALVSYSWEAFSMSDAMMLPLVGRGSKYLAAYTDADDNWLDGSKTYQLTIPANVPAKQFWSFIIYSAETRAFIRNPQGKPGITSLHNPVTNPDGSVTITAGPERPASVPESNFIATPTGEGWFTYFRTYAPTQAYFDKSWRLPDIKRAD